MIKTVTAGIKRGVAIAGAMAASSHMAFAQGWDPAGTGGVTIPSGGAPEINMAGLVTAVGLLACFMLTMDRKYRLQ